MTYSTEDIEVTIGPLIGTIGVIFLIVSKYMQANRETHAVHSRSIFLLLISNLANYSQIVISIILATLIDRDFSYTSSILTFLIFTEIALNNCLFIVNLLKLYRVKALSILASGQFRLKESVVLKKRLEGFWNFKVGIIYISLSMIPRLCIYIYFLGFSIKPRFFRALNLYVTAGQTCFECIILLFFAINVFFSRSDVTLKLEYFIYTFIWGCTFFVFQQEQVLVFYLILPIRNLVMLMISTVSIWEHNEHYKLPLPDVIDLNFVLQNEFLVDKIRDYLKKRKNKTLSVLFQLLLDIRIFLNNESPQYFDIIQKDLLLYQSLTEYSPKNISNDFSDYIQYIYDELYNEFNDSFFQNFQSSPSFCDIRIDYSSN